MDAKKLFLEHFDKLALGVAGVAFLSFFIFSVLRQSPAEAQSATVDRYNKSISQKLETAKSQLERIRRVEPKPAYFDAVRADLRGGPLPVAFPGWLFHKRPLMVTKVIGIEWPDPDHQPPVEFKGVPGLGRIALSWEESASNRLVVVERYLLQRRVGVGGGWQEAAQLEGAVHSYIDKQVEPRTQYWYRLVSHAAIDAENTTVQRGNIELPEDKQVTTSIEVGPFTTKQDVYLELVQVQARTRAQMIKGISVDEKAWIKVYKFFSDEGVWRRSRTFVVSPGGHIGEEVKEHGEKVDFTTGFELQKVLFKQLEKGGGGLTVSVTAHVARIRDLRSGKSFEINNQVKDPGLEAVIDEMKGGGSSE